MDELIEVYDENNNDLGYSLTRDEIHNKNLWHRHVSAWIMNKEGKILLQQRTFSKKKNPGKWSKTGGHVDIGETCETAIKREIEEEIGLKVKDSELINYDLFKSTDPNAHFYLYGYIVFTTKKETDFIIQKEELERVKYYDIEEIETAYKENNLNYSFSSWDKNEFDRQMNILKEYRNKIKGVGPNE